MTEKNTKPKSGQLQKEVADKYTLEAGIGIGPISFKGEVFDLSKITVEEADVLVKNGFTELVAKKPAPEAKVK